MLLKVNFITVLLNVCLLFATTIAKANNENPTVNKQLNVTVLAPGKVIIEAFATDQTATYEIEKSYDNKVFTIVAIMLPNEAVSIEKAFSLKDKVKTSKKKVYYRLKVINNNGVSIAATNIVSIL